MSLWEKYLTNEKCPSLNNNLEVDTLIIGGGLTGLNTLYFLRNEKSICLVEANKVGMGVTKATTGKITYLQENILAKVKNAQNYLKSQREAIKLLKNIIQKENINCDLDKSSSYLIARNKKENKLLIATISILKKEHISYELKKYDNFLTLKVDDTYVFNPIKYLNHLKKLLKKYIYEDTKIVNITRKNNYFYAKTSDNYTIKAKRVVIACHYPFFLKPLLLPLNTTIEKSTIVVTREKENKHYNYITLSKPTLSFRFYEDKQNTYGIYLSSSHNTALKENDKQNLYNVLKNFNLKEKDVIDPWTNIDIISGDNLPLMGQIEANLYISTAYNTWGMTNSILGAKIISDKIKNKQNIYENLFLPTRISKYHTFYQSIASNTLAFLKNIKKNKKWYDKNVFITYENNNFIGNYLDASGTLHQVYAICPHLKCPLVFNDVDLTWDCPCHSSRFSIDGKCLKGPSKYNISYQKSQK